MVNNLSFYDWVLIERKRLLANSFPDFVENSYGETYIIECDGNAEDVKQLIKDILLIFNNMYLQHKWFSNVEEWQNILPHDFSYRFAKDLTNEEAEQYRQWWNSLTYKQKLEQAKKHKDKPWSLGNWIETMHPIDRTWFWWGETILGDKTKNNYFIVAIKFLDDYYSFSPIETFFRNCGAKNISIYES